MISTATPGPLLPRPDPAHPGRPARDRQQRRAPSRDRPPPGSPDPAVTRDARSRQPPPRLPDDARGRRGARRHSPVINPLPAGRREELHPVAVQVLCRLGQEQPYVRLFFVGFEGRAVAVDLVEDPGQWRVGHGVDDVVQSAWLEDWILARSSPPVRRNRPRLPRPSVRTRTTRPNTVPPGSWTSRWSLVSHFRISSPCSSSFGGGNV